MQRSGNEIEIERQSCVHSLAHNTASDRGWIERPMRMRLWFTNGIFFYKTEGPEGGSDCVLQRTDATCVRTN